MVSDENNVTVNGTDLPISKKHAIEICNQIRGKNLLKSKAFLGEVIIKKKAVPFRRYQGDVGHRSGKLGSGRYPIKACKAILIMLESLEINAQNKGLDTAILYIKEIIPNKSSNVWRYGRQRRRKRKLTHLFVLAEETVKKGKKEDKKPESKESPKKTEQKGNAKEVKKPEPKKVEKKQEKAEEVKK